MSVGGFRSKDMIDSEERGDPKKTGFERSSQVVALITRKNNVLWFVGMLGR